MPLPCPTLLTHGSRVIFFLYFLGIDDFQMSAEIKADRALSNIKMLIEACLPILRCCFQKNWEIYERKPWIDRGVLERDLWRRELAAFEYKNQFPPQQIINKIKDGNLSSWDLQVVFWLLLRSKVNPLASSAVDRIHVELLDEIWRLLFIRSSQPALKFRMGECRVAALSLTARHAPGALPAMEEIADTPHGALPHHSLAAEIQRAALQHVQPGAQPERHPSPPEEHHAVAAHSGEDAPSLSHSQSGAPAWATAAPLLPSSPPPPAAPLRWPDPPPGAPDRSEGAGRRIPSAPARPAAEAVRPGSSASPRAARHPLRLSRGRAAATGVPDDGQRAARRLSRPRRPGWRRRGS